MQFECISADFIAKRGEKLLKGGRLFSLFGAAPNHHLPASFRQSPALNRESLRANPGIYPLHLFEFNFAMLAAEIPLFRIAGLGAADDFSLRRLFWC